MKRVLLLINSLSDHPQGDELDVLTQAEAVESSLGELGYMYERAYCDLNLERTVSVVSSISPDLVFNLVETLGGKGVLIHLIPSVLESLGMPFTGSGSYALMVTTDKIRTKKILREHRIPTPDWRVQGNPEPPDPGRKYLIKPVWEDGSSGITDASVVDGKSFNYKEFTLGPGTGDYFLEEFIDGREFNITMLAGPHGPEVMPVAEMLYKDYPAHKPKILNYASKWEPGSFEYGKTVRSFAIAQEDRELVREMSRISLQCWDLFGIRGYARVDFRVDQLNRPYVLEVNTNPCISPDAGFVAACAEGGVTYTHMIRRILGDI
jgi:D-alanine-D-alanine ligase